MSPTLPALVPGAGRPRGRRGSVLLTAMLFAIGFALVLASYLSLSRTSLLVAHRTFFAHDAANLAEAGLEEALACFTAMAAGAAPATAWAGWTTAGANATRTLTPFNRDQNAVGLVRVHVRGYDGSEAAPVIHAQATVTPFDGGAPVVKTVQLVLRRSAATVAHGVVALEGFELRNNSFVDSFNSSPTGNPVGSWLTYTAQRAKPNASVAVLGGSVDMRNNSIIRGNLYLGPGVAPPDKADVTGSIISDYKVEIPFPDFPTADGVGRSYDLGKSIPSVLPRPGDLPAADGRYHYFCANTTIQDFAVVAGADVTVTGTKTDMGAGIVLPPRSSLHVYMDGPLRLSNNTSLNSGGWAGALRIHTTTSRRCSVGNNCQLVAWFQAPNAELRATGNNQANMLVGFFLARTVYATGSMDIHYDESLQPVAAAATYAATRWLDLQSAADRATVAGATGNFLR